MNLYKVGQMYRNRYNIEFFVKSFTENGIIAADLDNNEHKFDITGNMIFDNYDERNKIDYKLHHIGSLEEDSARLTTIDDIWNNLKLLYRTVETVSFEVDSHNDRIWSAEHNGADPYD